MTTTTPETIAIPAESTRRPSVRKRFAIAFSLGLLVALAAGVGAIYAYDQQYLNRVLPGVRVGTVDLSGLDAGTAAERLSAEYGGLAQGEIVLAGPDGPITISYEAVGRRPDLEAMVAEALGVGRNGNPLERVVADARTAMRGATVAPRVTFDADLATARISESVGLLTIDPIEASVTRTEDGTFLVEPSQLGRRGDATDAVAQAIATLGSVDAPARLDLSIPVTILPPTVTTEEATAAKVSADRLTERLTLPIDGIDKPQFITTTRLREWTSFATTPDGSYAPTIDTTQLPAVLTTLARRIDRAPVNASFDTAGGKITGVVPSQNGYTMDVEATLARVETVFADRAAGSAIPTVEPALHVATPVLTTAQAQAAQPDMRRLPGGTWTTYFPISEKNGFGANIWIPARLIDGYVVAPRATFDFWDAIGPVTREKGYKDGGAIINGRTEPQGALAGGICSCSTTLFNAALRAGFQMGDRRNHYYYIDRYPLGLDATVFISASGARQTMSFTNDTDFPVLIRGYGYSEGNRGYVKFDLYSVPNGRTVSFSRPTVRNVRPASDSVQYTSSLAPGVRKRIEYPVDGKQVTVSRTVRDRDGNVIHTNTYSSNYSRITGIVLIGKGRAVKPAADPTPPPPVEPILPPSVEPLPAL